jgi:Family of unknown function (DUF6152)
MCELADYYRVLVAGLRRACGYERIRLMKLSPGVAISLAGLLAAIPVFAHHSGAAVFDTTKKIELKGVVSKMEWTNPHAHFYLDVKDAGGAVTSWNLELASPSILLRNGWKRDSLKAGDAVTVSGSPAKDNSNFAIAQSIEFADGHKLGFLSAYDDLK